MKCVTSVCQG